VGGSGSGAHEVFRGLPLTTRESSWFGERGTNELKMELEGSRFVAGYY
jgi:hypothetical protein